MRPYLPVIPLLLVLSILPACSNSTEETSTTTISASRTVAVHVLVEGDTRDWQVGGILLPGTSTHFEDVVGGFAAVLDADGSYETIQTVRTPAFAINDVPGDRQDRPVYPYVTNQALLVDPGLYMLIVNIGTGDLDSLLFWEGSSSEQETGTVCSHQTLLTVHNDHDAIVDVAFDLAFPSSFNCF